MSAPVEASVEAVLDPDGVAVVTFRRGRHNYFDHPLILELVRTLEDLGGRGARAAVLRSGVRHFCAGADFSGGPNPGGGAEHIYDLVPRLLAQPVPLVAAIGGGAIGGGLGLALAADFRVASTQAYLTANFTRIGLSQGFALSLTLPRLVGVQIAADLLYTGRKVGGAEAAALGLVDRVVEPAELDAEARRFAAGIAASAPLAVATARRALRADLSPEVVAEVLRRERAEQSALKSTADFAEGTRAARERRRPVFRGE